MRKLILLSLISYQVAAQAPKKISEYPAAVTITGTEETILNQGGVNRKATIDQIRGGTFAPLSFKTGLDALNGILKSNGSGVYSSITDNSSNWNTAFGWGNHAGLYRPISYVPAWGDVTGKPNFDSLYWKTGDTTQLQSDVLIDGQDLHALDFKNITSIRMEGTLGTLYFQGGFGPTSMGFTRTSGGVVPFESHFQHTYAGVTVEADKQGGTTLNKSYYTFGPQFSYLGEDYSYSHKLIEKTILNSSIEANQTKHIVAKRFFNGTNFNDLVVNTGFINDTGEEGFGIYHYTNQTLPDASVGASVNQSNGLFKVTINGMSLSPQGGSGTAGGVMIRGSGSGLAQTTTASLGTGLTISSNQLVVTNGNPTGGTTGQVLTKNSGTNYDYSWQDPSGGGATNLSFTGSATNGTINSDTGTDATIPLGNGTNSGLSLNDYTTAEKSKLAGITGTNTGDQTSIVGITGTKAQFNTAVTDGDFLYVGDVTSNATHTGDVTGATALTIANDAVTNEKAANMAVNTIKGRITAGTGDPEDLTATQVRTITETETTTQLNTRDTNNRNRANHTGTQLSDALYGSVSDPSRTVTANDAIVQADNGRIIYFDDTDPIVFLIDILTIDTQVALMNIGTGDVSIQSGTATVTTTVLSEGESALIVYQTTTNPIIQTSGAGGSGDVSSIETTSVDGEVVVFDGTTGKAVKRNDGTAKFPIVGLAATTFGANEVPYSSGTGNTLASSSSFNYDGTSLDAPEFNGVALTDAGDGNSVLRNDGTYGTVPATRKNALTIETDFYNETSPYAQGLTGTAISGGTDNVIASEPNHPGIIDIRDGTTANGGWMVQTASNAIRIAGGEKLVVTFQIRNARSTANGWIGLKDNTTNAQPVDGAYVYFVGNGTTVTMDARTRNNSTETINGTTWAPTLNTWYSLVITVNSDATSVNYEVFNDAGTSQWNVNNTTNIPTGSGRETGIGAQANESTTDAAAAIMYLDYFRFEINRTLTR